ncbi:unnamed protein product [Camellia sinensis]
MLRLYSLSLSLSTTTTSMDSDAESHHHHQAQKIQKTIKRRRRRPPILLLISRQEVPLLPQSLPLSNPQTPLSCKPYSFHIQRARLIHCFEAWGRYGDAEIEGFSVLESLRGIEIGGTGSKLVKKKFQYVPNLGNESVDHEFAFLDVEIVVTLVKCVSMKQSKEEGHYRRVLTLVDEVSPWFSALSESN